MRSADGWWRRLAKEPKFEAEMSERQRELGQLYEHDTEPQAALLAGSKLVGRVRGL
jgi:hypothetical protein